jgi:hypothetical protein
MGLVLNAKFYKIKTKKKKKKKKLSHAQTQPNNQTHVFVSDFLINRASQLQTNKQTKKVPEFINIFVSTRPTNKNNIGNYLLVVEIQVSQQTKREKA